LAAARYSFAHALNFLAFALRAGYALFICDEERFQLLFGPYWMPRCKVGKKLRCRLRGKV
jgi:hypothetical protein